MLLFIVYNFTTNVAHSNFDLPALNIYYSVGDKIDLNCMIIWVTYKTIDPRYGMKLI